MEKKTGMLLIGPMYYVESDGQVVLLQGGAMYPNLTKQGLAVIEDEYAEMWKRVRVAAGQQKE